MKLCISFEAYAEIKHLWRYSRNITVENKGKRGAVTNESISIMQMHFICHRTPYNQAGADEAFIGDLQRIKEAFELGRKDWP